MWICCGQLVFYDSNLNLFNTFRSYLKLHPHKVRQTMMQSNYCWKQQRRYKALNHTWKQDGPLIPNILRAKQVLCSASPSHKKGFYNRLQSKILWMNSKQPSLHNLWSLGISSTWCDLKLLSGACLVKYLSVWNKQHVSINFVSYYFYFL